MASHFPQRQVSSLYEKSLRRNRLRRILLEKLDRRELLAADVGAGIFAGGTSQEYIDAFDWAVAGGGNDNNGGNGSGNFNAPGDRWSNPVGGPSLNNGDPATISWSIVPDGTTDTANNSQTNLVAFMDGIYGGGSGPVEQRPWFNIFQRAYDRWSEVSGLNFIYEAADDGAPMGQGNRGVSGVRGDIRIGGRPIDGNFGVLAFNYFPNAGGDAGFDGDMIIDTNDSWYLQNADSAAGENRGLFNVLMHEAGHGVGLGHSIPLDNTKLMEPAVTFAFLGAQHDDILGTHDLYGDNAEPNDTAAQAVDLGQLSNGRQTISGNSIDRPSDDDWYQFNAPSSGRISLTLEPIGFTYEIGNQGGATGTVNTLVTQDLSLELISGGSVIAQASATNAGENEEIIDFDLPAGGDYQIRVIGAAAASSDPQLYDLTILAAGLSGPGVEVTPPRLLSVAPNVGSIFSFNQTDEINQSPNELLFRFDGSQTLDPASFDGIRITRAGHDGSFDEGNEIVLDPGFIGFGDSERTIVARFVEALPDDLYKVEIFAFDDADQGIAAVRNINGETLTPRLEGTDRDTIFFDLELGNQVVAVVHQPTSRDAGGNIVQARDQIEVYFSDEDLMFASDVTTGDVSPNPTVVDPSFYRLFSDKSTATNTDDILFLPSSIEYFADRNMAVLTFASNIDELDADSDTSFRLRVGTNEAVPSAPVTITPAADPGSTFTVSTSADLGMLNALASFEISEEIRNASIFPLDFPGAPDTPGVREILDDPQPGESHHLEDEADSDIGLTIQPYNFNKVDPVSFDATTGQPIFNSISPAQEQRAREIFELYGSYLGIQFVETEVDGWTIATANIDGVGGAIGVANGVSAIMDAAESWNDEFGANDDPAKLSWFVVAMHEIGHLLELAHSTELPPGAIMGGFYSDATLGGEPALLSGNPVEPIFPGATDLANAKYLHRPDSRDIDMYRFEIAPGSSGEFTAEVVAERLPDSSFLNSLLTLFRELPDGSREPVAVNDNYFSEDSYLKLDLEPGVYYLGVSASGNNQYDPEIAESGLGGTTEGNYQLRATFRPAEANSIVDVDGSALDGDADGAAGGVFNYWFNAAAPEGQQTDQTRSLFVDKVTGSAAGDGSLASPFSNIDDAFAAAQPGDVVRIVGNGGADGDISTIEDNNAYEVGTGGLGNQPLTDGATMNIPQGVTVVIDEGALFKMGRTVIGVGSSTSSGDQSRSNLQVLGTPEQNVFFTSYTNEDAGVDTDPLATSPSAGDWGGIIFRNALDRAEGRFDAELDGRFVNYVGNTDFTFGGGQVPVDGQNRVIAPLHMTTARPTLINNKISRSAFAAISADPNSFEESTFTTERYQADDVFTPDYQRLGPDIHGNHIVENSINGLFVRVETIAGQNTSAQTVSAIWDDTDIVHVVADTLTVQGTPGGPILETSPPELDVVSIGDGGSVPTSALTEGTSYQYRLTFLDANGSEGVASTATIPFEVPTGSNAIQLNALPAAGGDFVSRKLYRSEDAGATFQLVAELDRSSTSHLDFAAPRAEQINDATELNRARLDAGLNVAPGMLVKLQGGRIRAGVGAQIIAEGKDGLPVVFTSRQDDRYGAGGTFDTNNDAAASLPQPGDWGGLYFGHAGSGSIDNALITFGGGETSVGGNFAGFNAVEIHQANVRITNSVIENNADGTTTGGEINRDGAGFNEAAAVFIRGAQPVIVDNIIRDNEGVALSIDPMSLTGETVRDSGRLTGAGDIQLEVTENKGPLLRGNALGENDLNGIELRGATLTTESVWDDTDIVHIVQDEILIPDLYVHGGLRLQSSSNESLVVKFGSGAGITANGRPLDIDDRIGGSLHVVGTPGFPVVLTSLSDSSIGAGFDPQGRAQTDTDNTGGSASSGDWRGLTLAEFSNDRNVAIGTELEPAQSTGSGVNGTPGDAQLLGKLAEDAKSSDDNLRNGFSVFGTINNRDDIDVYSFEGTAGTQVWFDIDRTANSLDAVLELVDADGNIIAQSDNSLAESEGTLPLVTDPNAIDPAFVNPMQTSAQDPRNFGSGFEAQSNGESFADFYSTNPLDPGMRVVLPGATGSVNTYFVRVRSSNIDSSDAGANRADLQDLGKLSDGLTEGQYQLQLRLQHLDEFPGSSITYADIRFATTGIEILGGPSSSPLLGEAVELSTNNNTIANALDLGNLHNTDQAALSIAGDLNEDLDVDWYSFSVESDSIQSDGLVQHLATVIDVDYADGLGRADTSLWLFYDDQNGLGGGTGIRLVNFGTDSSIADDIGAPLNGSDTDDLSRGTSGVLDAFIGSTALPAGDYFLAITSNEQISNVLSQFYEADAGGNPLARVEPINSVIRIIEDRFGGSTNVAIGPLQTGFTGTQNQVPFTLGDVPLLISQVAPGVDTSEFITGSAITGEQTSLVSRFGFVEDIAIRGDGVVHGARVVRSGAVINDANSGGILQLDVSGDGATTQVTAGSGIQTFEIDFSTNPPSVATALTPRTGGQRQGVGMQFNGLTYPQEGSAEQWLYAVGSRGNGASTFQTLAGPVDAKNYIYKLDPTTLQATSAPFQDRQQDARIFGAGTQIVERGYIDTSIDVNQNATYQTITMSDASPTDEPALLAGDLITVRTPDGDFVFEWEAAQPSVTLVADTVPQSQLFNNPDVPTNFFQDGHSFTLTSGATTNTFEVETGRVLVNEYFALAAPATWDGSTFVIEDDDGDAATFEFDTGDGVVAGNNAIVYDAANSTIDQVSFLIVNAINNAVVTTVAGDGAWSVSAAQLPGTQRISLTGDTALMMDSAAAPISVSELAVDNTLGAGQTFDGATFTLTDLDGDAFTFEFDSDNSGTGTNTPITIDDTSSAAFIRQAVVSAINFPTGVNPPPANWQIRATDNFGSIGLVGDRAIEITASTATVINPLSSTPEYGLVDAAGTNILVNIEEYFTNLDDTQFLPTPSTPGAMDILVTAIDDAAMGIDADSIGTRLILDGADALDFDNMPTISANPIGGGGTNIPLPFNFTDDAATLNTTLLAALQAVEPAAAQMNDGRIRLPGSSSFIQDGTDDRLDANPKNARFSEPIYGDITGIAFSDFAMFGVSENGDLYNVGGGFFSPNSPANDGDFIETIYNPNTGNRVNFVSLTSGPRNAEQGVSFTENAGDTGLDNVLFGLGSDGILYAFDELGRPAYVFQDGAWFQQTDASGASGVAFSTLDVNLWHTSDNRRDDDGHGVNVSFDGSRRSQENGGNSLYFGFQNPTAPLRQVGDWTGLNNPGGNFPGYDAGVFDTYDFTGGAKGSVVSNTLDLSGYGAADKPFLYFNYYLQTQDQAAFLEEPASMLDAFRVFVAGDDGEWKLVGTNNSDYDDLRLVGQTDEHDIPFIEDLGDLQFTEAQTRQVSELFEAGSNGAPDNWRQARVDLSRFAGDENVRIRFDFSSSGTFDVGGNGAVELVAVAGDRIATGDTFQIDGAANTFEFDFGLALDIPSGAALADGETFEVDGTTFTFSEVDNLGDNILFAANESAGVIAARVAAKINALGLTANIHPTRPGRVSVIDAVGTTPNPSAGLPASFVADIPGVVAGRQEVLVHHAMTTEEVRDAIRVGLAEHFNVDGQKDNVDIIRFSGPSIFLWERFVTNAGPLGANNALQADEFGEQPSGATSQLGRGTQHLQNNRFEGVYVDDIVVGFAERGEMVTYQDNVATNDTGFVENPRHEPAPGFAEIETGTYQIEIRRGTSYVLGGAAFPSIAASTAFDTNHRHTQQTTMIAPSGAEVADGQTFTLSDGINIVTFEFDDNAITSGDADGIAQGNVALPFNSTDTAEELAITIRDAINSPNAQAILNITAGLSDGTVFGNQTLNRDTSSKAINLHGNVASDNSGGADFGGLQQFTVAGDIQSGFILYGLDEFRLNEAGDSNSKREQGQILVHSNTIRDSSGFGIRIDAGTRANIGLIPLAGALPHAGPVRNLVQFNEAGLVPGPVVINNLIYANAIGGILFSGDTRSQNQQEAPVPFGRIVNNTVVGLNGNGVGIQVSDNASPTLLNNIVAGLSTGVSVDASSNTTVIGATTYKDNGTNFGGALTGPGTDAQLLGPDEPLFVDASSRNYYLADGTRAIDASIDSLNDRQQMTTVRDPLGIAVSPILAPDRDLTGVLRVDDPDVSNPNGTGGNPFKDRGAYDRADFFGPVAIIQQPLDNDPDGVDEDGSNTFIQLSADAVESLEFFSILLFEEDGTGPAPATVTSESVILTENGRRLTPDADYIFGYNPSSRLIRLTPLSGVWRNDSVYEITLNNQDGIRVFLPEGSAIADGDSFTLNAGTDAFVFEFDSDGSVAAGSIAVPYDQTYSRFEVTAEVVAAIRGAGLFAYAQGDDSVMIHGADSILNAAAILVPAITDVADNPLQANRINSLTQFTILMPNVQIDFGDAASGSTALSGDGSRHALLPVDAPQLALGTFADADDNGTPSTFARADDRESTLVDSNISGLVVGLVGQGVLQMPAPSAALDGQTIFIFDLTSVIALELDVNGSTAAGTIPVDISTATTADDVAIAVADAANSALFAGQIQGIAALASGSVVDLGVSEIHSVDVSGAPDISRIITGRFELVFPDVTYSDGQFIELSDGVGRITRFELNDTASASVSVSPDAVAVNVDLTTATTAEIVQAFADAISLEVARGFVALGPAEVDDTTLIINGDDEDGVEFGGLFNADSIPVTVSVTSTGPGFLDVWIDWNQDGSFTGTGERIVSAMPVRAGTNTFDIVTPDSALTGFTMSRFRVSTKDDLLIGGVGIGGEVEDHLIEIVSGSPPVVADDEFSVNEDEILNVGAPGVLANDTDADSGSITVRDEDPLTPGLQPLQDVTRGSLVLFADGSFDYTPDPDFFGTDTFVYQAIDARLVSGSPATVTITVNPINDTPTATDDETTIFEDQALTLEGSVLTANDFRGVFGTTSQTNELDQDLSIIAATVVGPASLVGSPIDVTNDVLTFTPPAHYNDTIDGPILVEVTIQDNGQSFDTASGMLVDDFLTDTGTLTINVTALNDSPEFDLPAQDSILEDAGPQVRDPFITNIAPGPGEASDEDMGPGSSPENQTVSFTVNALNPELFASGPSIDANGVLSYELNPHVNNQPPFPPEILVEVLGVDTGTGESILRNLYDPSVAMAGSGATYDGATLTVTDLDGNSIVLEFDDARLPGVGSSGGVDHIAVPFDDSDDMASMDAKIVDALNNPPAANVAGGGTWGVSAFIDAVTGEIRIIGEASAVANAGGDITALTNIFTSLAADETYDGATVTITDADGDTITFEFEDSTATAPAVAGITDGNSPILYDPAFTRNELSSAISDAINAPDATVLAGLTGTWDVVSFLPATSDQMQLSNVDSLDISADAAPIINPLASESFSGQNPLEGRPAHDAVVRTFTIVVEAINDAPEFDLSENPINLLEDAGPQAIEDFVINAAAGPPDAEDELASQSLTLTVTAVDPSAFASLPTVVNFDPVAGTSDLEFELAPDVNNETGNDLTILVTLMDDGGTASGGVDTTVQTLTLSVTPVNDAPIFTLSETEITVFEDDEDVTGSSPTTFVGFAVNPTQGPDTAVDETTLAATQQELTFETVSVSDPSLFEVQPSISPTGDLSFVTADNQNGQAVVVVRLMDNGADGTTGNGDENTAVPDQTFTINITAVNDPPEFEIPTEVSSFEDQGLVQVANFATNLLPGPDSATDEAGQQFIVSVVAADPTAFTIQPEIAADGTLSYQTGPDVNSDNADLRVFVTLTDDGTPGPLPDNNTSETKTFQINADAINDAPTFNVDQAQVTVIEDVEQFEGTTITTVAGLISNPAPGPATAIDETSQILNFVVVSVSSPDLFEIQPSVDQAGTLTFKTALHKNGTSLVVVQLVDDGVGTPPPNDNDSILQTLTITLSPINDAPEFSIPGSITVNEDAGLVSQSGFATNVLRGPAGTDDENIQQISFTATATDPSAFTTQPTIAPDGTLSFQTAPDVNSNNANLEVTVQLMDNGAASPPPNDNSSDVQTFTIIATPVNDPPIPDEFVATTDEDAAVTIDAADVLVGDAPGPDDEAGQSLTMTQIERTSLNGGTVEPVFSGTEIVSFTYTPPANLVGDDSFLYVVTDDGSPARSGSGTIVINITGVNDAPEFSRGSDQIAPEDSGTVTVESWATNILAGPANALDELASQSVTFDVNVDNSGLFEELPAVSSDGTLTFKPSTDANGTAVVTVTAVDDGASDAPNVNTSAPQTFTITISPVNDAPAFTSGPDVTVDEDSGAYSQAWATDIAAAAGLLSDPPTASDEAAQVVDFAVTNDQPALFTVQPSVSSDGQLEFTPAENAVGSAVVVVTAVDRGPADGQNVNTSAPQTFTITLTPINDPPLAIADNYNTDENSVLSVGGPGLLANDTDVDLPGDSLSAVAATTTSSLGAVVVINEDGSFSYDPSEVVSIQQMSNGQSVLDNFTYTIEDSEGLTSANNVSINVSGVDDPPVAIDDAYSMGVGQSRLLDVLTNDTDIDTAIDPRTITITSLPTSGSATVNQTGVIEYQAGAGFRGVDQLGYTVRDGSGNVSNEAFVTITINNPPIAQDDSTFTFKNEPIIIDVLDNDSDPDGTIDPATLQIVANPSPSGTAVVLDDGTVEFTPSTDFFGNVEFSYVVSDDIGTVSNVADVLVRVQRSRWQNPNGNLDVNADGFVTPIDALIVVNYLNGDNESFLPSTDIDPAPFLDPTGDESVTPLDALVIINFLNNNSGGGGAEGEADLGSQAYVMMVTPEQIIATVGEQVVREIQESLDQSMMEELGMDLDSAFIGPVLPAAGLVAEGEGEEDDSLFESLTCSDKFAEDSMDEALADMFDDEDRMGPFQS